MARGMLHAMDQGIRPAIRMPEFSISIASSSRSSYALSSSCAPIMLVTAWLHSTAAHRKETAIIAGKRPIFPASSSARWLRGRREPVPSRMPEYSPVRATMT